MVRVFIKGGVWKNSEDEILKAAVQKYGKQQWARVASLLNKKSAKQCKARWHEWLDPSVRKVEWSRAEEEKLLHLAKLMPAQWKTIAPLVGRTAAQCQEHYEQLLDQAAGGEDSSSAAASLRGFQPGQIDSHPETKPARPDPIDMDEDEIEMLQEARARLANTQGKKAKRKAREKMLAQAKRLADLQKRRELKQAGLLSSAARKKAKRKSRDIDLGVEIPFHKPAPAGFHDTSSEAARGEVIRQKRLKQVDFKQVNENQYRTRDREAAQAKKKEQRRQMALQKSSMQYVVQQVSKKNDPLQTQKRGKLELPAPAVSDKELGQLAKYQANQLAGVEPGGDPSSATHALLGDYADRPLPTPMRTPATGSGMTTQESILKEASKLRKLEQVQTPLLGTSVPVETVEDEEDDDEDDDAAVSTKTPRLGGGASTGTPAPNRAGYSQTPSVAAPRDELGLNRRFGGPDDASVGASTFASTFATSAMSIKEMAREERRAAKRARLELEQALAALPAPQFEYELSMPQEDDMDVDGARVETVEPDAADVEAAELERLRKKAEKLYEARSSVVKRKDLPRPKALSDEISYADAKEEAERLIQEEMVQLLQHDAHAFPVLSVDVAEEGKKKKKKRKQEEVATTTPEGTSEVPIDYLPEEYLDAAKDSVQVEFQKQMDEMTTSAIKDENAKNQAEALAFLVDQSCNNKGAPEHVFVKGGWASAEKVLESRKLEFETLQEAAMVLRKKNEKAEAKLGVVHGGYSKRADKVCTETLQCYNELQNARIEEAVYRKLQSQELAGAASRIDKLKEEIESLEADEALLQKRYSDLLVQKKRLGMKRRATA
ncbi:cycle 5-like protein [Seminavis robusta]|uniref:Cycle 5-like protein n=1 Tax=Seminavis robusta TaxID=568900 RepID=A0A9N8DLT7_9STRA|nr:cycle 5-like protein [Seminavis robusta]|eukprot:Sro152_g069500.1 cycle 5-like protein (833) ;mRNA; f:60176-62674